MRLLKLVRDRIPGEFPSLRVSYKPIEDHEERVKAIRKKLVEEVAEYLLDPSIEEAADIADALNILIKTDLNRNWGELMDHCRYKTEKRGGFDRVIGLYVEETEEG
jgi:predicted house-cleaning noncanonical NTP pyrophosphatase (MazG superfamily)